MNRIQILALTLVLAACSHAKMAYVGAKPLNELPPPLPTGTDSPTAGSQPTAVAVPVPIPFPGQLKSTSSTSSAAEPPADPATVIANANRAASQGPSDSSYFNAMMQYDFVEGALFQVYCAPTRLTDIVLQPGEKVLGRPAAGDTIRWIMALGKSSDGTGVETQHVYVKPTRAGADTTLVITTDRRTYHIELHAFKDTYMAAVQWHYPMDDLARFEAQAAQAKTEANAVTASIPASLENLNFRYSTYIIKGSPTWIPTQIFDDGTKVYVRLPEAALTREVPALFVLQREDQTQLVNYRMKNGVFIVDRLFDQAELRLGQKNQDIVRIVRN